MKTENQFYIGQKIKCNLEGGIYKGFIKNFEFFERDINRPVIAIEIKKSCVSPHLERCGLFGFLDTQDSPHTKVCGFPKNLGITEINPNHDYLNQRELRIFPNYQIKNPQDYNNWIKKLQDFNVISPTN